jgi:hypothetical protein
MFTGCTSLNNFINRIIFTQPESIARYNVDLTKINSFNQKIDFKTNNFSRDKLREKGIGPYYVVVVSKSIQEKSPKFKENWEILNYRNSHSKGGFWRGEIDLEWTGADGDKKSYLCKKPIGDAAFECGILTGRFFLPVSKEPYIADVKISITQVDTLLSEMLESPQIWIYRGGGSK